MSEQESEKSVDSAVTPLPDSATPAPIRAMRVIALSRDSRPMSRPPGALPSEVETEAPLPTFEDRPTPDWRDIRTQEVPPAEPTPEPPWHDAPSSKLPSFADELSEEPTPVFPVPPAEPPRAPSPPPPRFPSDSRALAPERSEPRALAPEAIEELQADELADEAETPIGVAVESVEPPAFDPDDPDGVIVDVEPSPISAPEVAHALRPVAPPPVSPPASLPEEAKSQLPAAADRPPPPKRPGGSGRPALPTAKVRKKPWWEEVFGDDFSRTYRSPTVGQLARETDFIADQLGLSQGSVILDLACGQGEYAVELSRRGHSVVGYDLSVFQLAMAADRAQASGQRINFLQGDMREMAFDGMFDAILSWNTSFGYFEEDRNFDVLCRMRKALRPGGILLLEIQNRDYAAREAPISNWYEGDGCICMDDMTLDFITSRLNVKRSVILDDGRSKEVTYSVRLYCLSEIGKLLHDAGFTVQSVSGSPATPGAFLGGNSPSMIIRAERPVE